MKQINIYLQLLLTIITATVFIGCSLTLEKANEDDYFFRPVHQIAYQKADSGAPVMVLERFVTRANSGVEDSLMEMLRQQNKRLDEVVQKLSLLAKKENTDNSMNVDNLGDLLSTRDRISNEMLVEMIRDQNQRLNDVIEQLKLLSPNQSMYHSNLVARNDAAQVRRVPVQQIPVSKQLIASLNYGKAIKLYQNKQYGKAINAFKNLLSQRIEPTLADRYHFWMGVCYFNLNRGNEAFSEFTKVLGYAKSDKAESAYFMIGQCYERTGAKKNARMAFEQMLRMYPQGSLKQVAEKKLALLK
jgi:TolA-binding protein